MDREVEVETLGGATLAIGGTAGVILVVPLEATITEVEGQAEPKSEAIPASAIVVEAPQDAVAGADRSAMPAEQELMAVATVVEPNIEADNGVIHGIDLVLLPRRRYGRSKQGRAVEDALRRSVRDDAMVSCWSADPLGCFGGDTSVFVTSAGETAADGSTAPVVIVVR